MLQALGKTVGPTLSGNTKKKSKTKKNQPRTKSSMKRNGSGGDKEIGVEASKPPSGRSFVDEPVSDSLSEENTSSWRVFLTALLSLALLWLSFPPVGLWWLAWLAPAPLIWLVLAPDLPGRRPYWQLYWVGFIYWLATFYFIPIPHPALWLAWIALGLYLAVYIPLLVGFSRVLVRDLQLPALLFIPIVWTGLEWCRGHFATGHSFACLSHTQYLQPIMIQTADIFGAYTITFAIAMVSVGVGFLSWPIGKLMLGESAENWSIKKMDVAFNFFGSLLMLGVVLLYGQTRLNEPIQLKGDSVANIGLIQSSHDVIFSPMTEQQLNTQTDNKRRLTHQAREQWNDLDLIVWPESGFIPYTDLLSNYDDEVTVEAMADARIRHWSDMTGFPSKFANPIPMLTGGMTSDPAREENFNSAFLISTDGTVAKRYFKNHLVMFGEYIPFSQQFPFLESLSPQRSLTFGTKFESITVKDVNLAPSICFESTVPHFIRRQLNQLADDGNEPDAMVNLTNDGWFFGTSCLDLHLACNVMRAVEMRKPHLIASNTGISANIDSCGRLLEAGPKRAETVIRAQIKPANRSSFYREHGEWIPLGFACVCGLAAVIGLISRIGRGSNTGDQVSELSE